MRTFSLAGVAAAALCLAASPGSAGEAAESPAAKEAAALANQGRNEEAAAKFREAAAKDPKNASLRFSLGLVCQALKRYPEAVEALEAAAALEPKSPRAPYSLGLLFEAAAMDPERLGLKQEPPALWRKAKAAWERVAELEKDPKKRAVARKHSAAVSERLQGP